MLKSVIKVTLILLSSLSINTASYAENKEELELCDEIINVCEKTVQDLSYTIELQDKQIKIYKEEIKRQENKYPWYFWFFLGATIGISVK